MVKDGEDKNQITNDDFGKFKLNFSIGAKLFNRCKTVTQLIQENKLLLY